jgi:hypothetical protein
MFALTSSVPYGVEQAFMPAVLLLKKSALATEVSLSRYTISEATLAISKKMLCGNQSQIRKDRESRE